MSKKTFISLFINILFFSLSAQTVQDGIVQEYNEKAKKTPLSDVELRISRASSTTSDSQGRFSLEFLTLQPGEHVSVSRIEKLGYEIFNKDAIEQWNLNPKDPFVIVMCRSDKFKKIRDNYEKISSESYACQLEKEKAIIDKLKEEGKLKELEYNRKLNELQENYYRQLDNLNNYIDRFSRIDISDISETEQNILDLVQCGYINEAIERYEDLHIKEKLIEQINNRNTVQEAISSLNETKKKQTAYIDSLYAIYQRQIDTLLLKGGCENNRKIACLYHEMALIDKSNIDWLIKSGYFIKNYIADYALALEIYELALDSIKNNHIDNPVQESLLYNNIGMLYDVMGENVKALEYYYKSLDVYITMEEFESPAIATTYNNIGSVYNARGDFSKALDYYTKALDIYESFLGFENSKVADLYNNLGSVYVSLGDYDKAMDHYTKSLTIRERIHNVHHPDVANSYNNIGHLYNTLGKLLKAWEYYCKALAIYEKTYGDRHPYVAFVYNNIGTIYCSLLKEYETALEYHYKSIDILERIYGTEHLDLANIYINIGFEYYCLQNYNKALELYDKALNIYTKKLPENHPAFIDLNDKLESVKLKIIDKQKY